MQYVIHGHSKSLRGSFFSSSSIRISILFQRIVRIRSQMNKPTSRRESERVMKDKGVGGRQTHQSHWFPVRVQVLRSPTTDQHTHLCLLQSSEWEIKRRIRLARNALGRHNSTLRGSLPLCFKGKIINQFVLPVMTYGSET